jgi:hypothetical protein
MFLVYRTQSLGDGASELSLEGGSSVGHGRVEESLDVNVDSFPDSQSNTSNDGDECVRSDESAGGMRIPTRRQSLAGLTIGGGTRRP